MIMLAGVLPTVNGQIVRELQQIPTFNVDIWIATAIVNLSNSNLYRVLYSFGFGASVIGEILPVNRKLLALTGEIEIGGGAPHAMTLSASIFDVIDMVYSTELSFEVAKRIRDPHRFPFVQARDVPIERNKLIM